MRTGPVTQQIQSGYLLIADISGFTSFIARNELDHGQAIVRQVLAKLVDSLTPTMRLCEVEGDAVFVYAPHAQVSRGELVAELVESTYAAFRDQQRTMLYNATCPCRACRQIGDLDLKFVVHYGDFVLQDLAGKTGPVGSSVNLAHRLLKSRLAEETGWSAYAMYTAAALGRIGFSTDGMHGSMESYEHLGTARVWSMDLHARYDALCARRRIYLGPDEAHGEIVRDFHAPRPVVWDWLGDTGKRTRWMPGSQWISDTRPAGRTGPQASNHCATYSAIEHVLDWRPFDYYTVRITSRGVDVLMTVELKPSDHGTQLSWRVKVELPLPTWVLRKIAALLIQRRMQLEAGFDEMERLIEEERPDGTVAVAD
jgi:carbon monoxide dehydrogenase subunit G